LLIYSLAKATYLLTYHYSGAKHLEGETSRARTGKPKGRNVHKPIKEWLPECANTIKYDKTDTRTNSNKGKQMEKFTTQLTNRNPNPNNNLTLTLNAKPNPKIVLW